MRDVMDILKALGDENRVRIVLALQHGELCVCQLIALLQLAPSTVSRHLSLLRAARLVESRKEGRWSYYRLVDAEKYPLQIELVQRISSALESASRVVMDRKKLEELSRTDMEALCRKIMKKS
ncbi:MAG: winged helix-turn-helix transcriptional regulator [Kiritimatiellae bacterium]|nr:winged helix-turn-helix transcriptional regulator [Kiritimatiellia bacterium]